MEIRKKEKMGNDFYMVGGIEEAIEKSKKLEAEAA